MHIKCDSQSKWKPVTSGVPWGSLDLYWDQYCLISSLITLTLGLSAPSVNLQMTLSCGAVDSLAGRDAIQRDLERVDELGYGFLVKSNKAKCKVLHLGQGNSQDQYRLGNKWIKSSTAEELRVLVDKKLDMS